MIEKTLSIIKPDAYQRNLIGKIVSRFEEEGLRVAAIKSKWLTRPEAQLFYDIHRDRPFFQELVSYMISHPVVLMVLEGENAVARNREIMGATDPADAAEGTIRKLFARSKGENSVHGSDSPENAKLEIAIFFTETELLTPQN